MFAGFFIRLMFGVLLFLIAAKKGYGKLFWGAAGILLGPFALIGIFLYRENVSYKKALLSGVTGAVIGASLALAGWFIIIHFPPEQFATTNPIKSETFWNVLLPIISLTPGFLFFCITLAIESRNNHP